MTGSSIDGQDGPPASKLARLDEMEKVRKQFAARLDAPKIKKSLPTDLLIGQHGSNLAGGIVGGSAAVGDSNTTSLRDSMSNEQIAALKAKRLAKKRSTIIDADTDLEGAQSLG